MAAVLARLRRQFRRWATRAKVPEAQPITLRQARVYVFPSRAGFALLLTLLLMFIAAVNYNLSLGYALTFFLGSVGVVHILHSWRSLTRLQISLQASDEAFAGGSAHWQISLINAQNISRPAIRVLDADGRELLCADLAPNATFSTRIALPCAQRGPLQPGQLTIETRQPLGWIRAWSYIEPYAPQLIFPTPAGSQALPLQAGEQADSGVGQILGQDDFAGLRGFHPGDSLRHVAWKQLASGRGMLTKIFASGQAPTCVLDWHALPPGMPLESRLSQLTQWILAARQSGARTTLILPNQRIGPGQDAIHHHTCLSRLALFEKIPG
ncbi:hypothetical protein GCM10027046_35620 [Uliginosibacterium flavum]|uniref:DUF58 domain-containing protein n=1 Tax=Uliginosibacterium flavum TaxID=1396831 RepID=A0ABV2TNH4_9RHOO